MHSQRYRLGSRQTLCSPILALLILALCGASPAAPWPELDAQGAGARHGEWVQTSSADFAAGEWSGILIEDRAGGELTLAPGASSGVYTSTVGQADFAFTAAAPFWRLVAPAGPISPSELQVELRVRSGGTWSGWVPAQENYWIAARAAFYPEAPVLVEAGEAFQYRVRMGLSPAGSAPALDAVGVVYMDAGAGPTAEQARATAEGGPIGAQEVPKPAVISRAGWGADESWMTWPPEYRAVEKIVVHHTATTNDYDPSAAAGWVRVIYQYHAVTLDWGDIGYNYLIDRYGNIYEGRAGGPGVVAGHALGYNYGSMGVSLIGDHVTTTISAPSLASLADIVAWEAGRSAVHPLQSSFFRDKVTPNLAGHRDYNSTACPGDALYAELPALRTAVWERVLAQGATYGVLWPGWTPPFTPLPAGSTLSTEVQVRNSGWMTWTQAGGGGEAAHLAYRWLDAGGSQVSLPPGTVLTTPVSAEVTFGGIYTFAVQLTTPITAGAYVLEWEMARADSTPFHTLNPDSQPLTRTIAAVDMFTVTGALDDLYGAPLPGAAVTASNGWSTAADAAGTYTLPLPISGAYTLTACPPWPGGSCTPATRDITSTGAPISYSFALPPLGFLDVVTNGHMEVGLDGWTTGGAIVTSTAHTGLGGLALRAEAPGSSAWISQQVTLSPGAAAPMISLFYQVPSADAETRLEVEVSGDTGTVTHTLPLVEGWMHWNSRLPAGMEGELTLSCRIVNGEGTVPAVVVVDEMVLGYRTGLVYLPAVLRANPEP